jgi:hypothetical protein
MFLHEQNAKAIPKATEEIGLKANESGQGTTKLLSREP